MQKKATPPIVSIVGNSGRQEVPVDLVNDLSDYYALLQIRKSKEMIVSGNPHVARALLKKVGINHKHRKEWIWWFFWSSKLPFLIMPFVRRLYGRFR